MCEKHIAINFEIIEFKQLLLFTQFLASKFYLLLLLFVSESSKSSKSKEFHFQHSSVVFLFKTYLKTRVFFNLKIQ